MTPENATLLRDWYAAGATIEDPAAQSGLSYRRVRETLIALGVTIRPAMRRVPPCPPGLATTYEQGASIRQVAGKYDLTYSQARNMLRHAGVALRGRGQPSSRVARRGGIPVTTDELELRNAAMVEAVNDGESYSEIATRFDLSLSWTGAILRASGAPSPDHGKGVRVELDFAPYVLGYYAGGTVRELAEAAATTYSTMRRGLLRAGCQLRPRGGPRQLR